MNARVGWTLAAVAVIAAFLLLGLVLDAVSPAPQGPALSSYATSPGGVAAWAELLERAGHRVSRLRRPVEDARLAANATMIVLPSGPLGVSAATARRVEAFVAAGGWLVVSGGAGAGALRASGRGRIEQIGDPAFLENRRLAVGDNAWRALGLAGARSRPVVFDESIHGFGAPIGLAALPARWWVALALLAAAAGAWILSRAVRLGGADPLPVAVTEPRTAYVTAIGQALRRTRDRDRLAEFVLDARERERTFERSL